MEHKLVFAMLAFLFSAAAYFPYVLATLRATSRPTLSTWISWGIMDAMLLTAVLSEGSLAAYQMSAYVIGTVAVIVACLIKRAHLGWNKLDTACVSIVVMAAVSWKFSESVNAAIVCSLIAACVGTWPLIQNLRKDPSREPFLPWVLVSIGGMFAILAVRTFTVVDLATPAVFLVMQIYIVSIIWKHRASRKTAKA